MLWTAPPQASRCAILRLPSTSGESPGLAKALRRRLERIFPVTLGPLADKIGKARKNIMKNLAPSPERTRQIKELLRSLKPLKVKVR